MSFSVVWEFHVPADNREAFERAYGSEGPWVDLFEEACRKYADKVAYISMGKEMTYREVDNLSRDFAGWLQSLGFGKGDRVALMMPNVLQYPIAIFGMYHPGPDITVAHPIFVRISKLLDRFADVDRRVRGYGLDRVEHHRQIFDKSAKCAVVNCRAVTRLSGDRPIGHH